MVEEITFVEKEYSDEEIFSLLRPYIVEWFRSKYSTFTPPQRKAIPEIKKGNNVLISSPTGTGKTLAAFLGILDELFRLAEEGKLEDKVYVVYVSPLRALNNDMKRNLIGPLSEIEEFCEKLGYGRLKIRVAVRTSDTSPYEKQKMLKEPPHILITTPESFAIALVAPRFRKLLKDVKWVIVDEIHELCSSKRGVHLSLSIERLEHYVGRPLIRIGLSATIAPLIEVAKFLVGYDSNGRPRKCRIVDARFAKPISIKVISPLKDIVYATAEEINEAIYSTLVEIIRNHRTALVFTNTRSATERVVYKLRKIFKTNGILDADLVEAHHSSLSRDIRLSVEEKLKKGLLKAVVCVSPESMVLTTNGWRKIVNIQKENSIYCLDFKDLKLKQSSFNEVLIRDYQGKGYFIETSLGYNIKCTPDHKFLVLKDSNLLWKNAEELKIGDYVAIVRRINTYLKDKCEELSVLSFLPEDAYLELNKTFLSKLKGRILEKYGSVRNVALKVGSNPRTLNEYLNGRIPFKYGVLRRVLNLLDDVEITLKDIMYIRANKRKHLIKPFKFDSDFMRFLGFWMAEGSWYNGGLSVFSSDFKMLSKYKDLVVKIFGINPKFTKTSSGIYGLIIPSTILLKVFEKIVKTTKHKSKNGVFPDFIHKACKEAIIQFLSGYFDGNGYLEVKNGKIYSVGFVTFNKSYAEGLHKLLLRIGIVSSLRRKEYDNIFHIKNRTIRKQGTCYTIAILGGEYLRKFKEIIDPWRSNLKHIKNITGGGYSNRDIIPNISALLKEIREKLGLSKYFIRKVTGYNLHRVEQGLRNISRRNLLKLVKIYKEQASLKKHNEILHKVIFLEMLALGDVFFDKIVKKNVVNLSKVCSLVNTSMGNYIVNGFICKNCSTSLELGIDIGYIDVVALLSSPKSVSRLLQRVGRSGHKLRNLSKGILIVVDRDDLVECTVLAKAALERKIDNVRIPKNALDVLAQHIVGMALERKWKVKEAYELVRRSYNYHDLSFGDFMSVLKYLAGAYEELRSMKVYAKIWLDEEEGVFGRRGRGKTRMIYYMNSGTIPDEAKITVITDKGRYLGTIDEQFLQILVPGDVFVLGGRTYKFVRSYGSLVLVKEVEGERPTVPSWFSEMLPLSFDSALLVGKFRRTIAKMIDENENYSKIIEYIVDAYKVERKDAESIYKYILEEYLFTGGIVPGNDLILIEVYDEPYRRNIIFHTLYGRRVNDALSRAYGYILSKMISENVKITITDNGFVLTIPLRNVKIEDLLSKVSSRNIINILKEALKNTELLKRRFRHCAKRAFMILKRYMSSERSVHRLQLNAQNLLKIVENYENFPVLKETYREILEDFMDVKNAIKVLRGIEEGRIKVKVIGPREVPSPFAHNMLLQGYSDVVLMEDRRTMLLKLHRKVMEYLESLRSDK